MRICQVITSFELGGAEKLLANFCNIHVQEHEVHVIYFKGKKEVASLFSPLIHIHHIPTSIYQISELRKLFRALKPDVIHTHLAQADWVGMIACAGMKVRKVCTMHNIWFKWNWIDYLIFTVYRILFNILSNTCQIVCISKSVAEHVRYRLGVSEQKIKLLYNAIPSLPKTIDKNSARMAIGVNPDSFVVLFVGRLEVQKSVHTLIEATAELRNTIPTIRIEIVGNGSLKSELEKLVETKNLGQYVHFKGTTFEPEIYFAAADIFVLPSAFEGLGIVILEAFRASVPVVASNLEGPQELLQNGKIGMLFEPGNSAHLSQCIHKLYSDQTLREKFGAMGCQFYKEFFQIEDYAKSLLSIYSL